MQLTIPIIIIFAIGLPLAAVLGCILGNWRRRMLLNDLYGYGAEEEEEIPVYTMQQE